jgi:nucleoside 2-deoxyribosyltransferase
MKAYIASGWFTPAQESARKSLLMACDAAGVKYYSPKDDMLYIPDGKVSSNEVFNTNLKKIDECNFILASTEGKDMGTVFECGYGFCISKPIIYYWLRPGPFNLMLAESANAVATSYFDLVYVLKLCVKHNEVVNIPYNGGVE